MRELIKAFDTCKKTFSKDAQEVKLYLPKSDLLNLNIPGKINEGELTITWYVNFMSCAWVPC